MFASSAAVADAFYHILRTDHAFTPSEGPRVYTLVLYNAASVAPQRGYVAEQGAPPRTIAVSTENRLAVLDVDAKPYFLDNSAESTPGEQLLALGREPALYADKLADIAAALFTPSVSPNMRRFPHETTLAFTLKLVDVSAVVGRMGGVSGDSKANKPLGSTFDPAVFHQLVQDVFRGAGEKRVSIAVEHVDVENDLVMAMALARAFSVEGLDIALDSESLNVDLVQNETEGAAYFVDKSFVAHVPMVLFSFADDSRVTHFKTGESVRSMVVEKNAVFMIENRLRDAKEKTYATTTSEAAKDVLEMICGVNRHELGYLDARKRKNSVLLHDIVRRNVLRQELDWSEASAARKAVDLLNFEGLDPRLIPHEKGSAIADSRAVVRDSLQLLYGAWERAVETLSVANVEGASLQVIRASKRLEEQLHEEICNQPLSEEILLNAEVEGQDVKKPNNVVWLFYLMYAILPVIAGGMFGFTYHQRMQRNIQERSAILGEIPVSSPRHKFVPPSTGLWFSTLTNSDKPKTN
ncbi:unnamed protein product [Chondrus crispus]|uniref:Uncharacterized protein n=1 Tax=Chondrus crispus TaxID=2769 RepID=R7QMS6_CHOCR|nr:unnamed protein product [Chondrus crispus]CDF39053.1 unnamed protein product [Chondrus crispus]|eukprot:XP_005718964.1 unnamed protein product [Chondrus crispus]